MIYYENFDGLCHRDGGISHSVYTKDSIPEYVKQYYKDILNIYDKEVIPYLNNFKTAEKYRILRQFKETILYYSRFVPCLKSYLKIFDKARTEDTKLKYYWKMQTLKNIIKEVFEINLLSKIKKLFIYNEAVPITVIIWIITSIFLLNNLKVNNNNILLLLYIVSYFIIYMLTYFVSKLSTRLNNKYVYAVYLWMVINMCTINWFKVKQLSLYGLFIINLLLANIIIYIISKIVIFTKYIK